MRIRLPFAGAFTSLCLLAAYLGLSSHSTSTTPGDPPPSSSIPSSPHIPVNDKVLHFVTFFLLTLTFYWVLDTSRRRVLHLTLVTVTLGLGIGSEFLQSVIPNGRAFDLYDIAANVVGSLTALGGCGWYHNRMLERKRIRRGYGLVAGEEADDGVVADLELGNVGSGVGPQESGVTTTRGTVAGAGTGSLEHEVDSWDENLEDAWDADGDEEHTDNDMGVKTPSASSTGEADSPEGKKWSSHAT